MGSKKAPAPPIYIPPPPAPQAVIPPDPQTVVPQVLSPLDVTKQGLEVEQQLPDFLQLKQDPLSPEVLKQYEDNYYSQYVNPQVKAAEAQIGNNGQIYSSFGGGLVGQIRSQGELDKFNAGLGASQQAYNNLIQGRTSLFTGGIGLAQDQNNADVSRGLGVAGLQSQNAGSLNGFNSDIYGSQIRSNSYQNDFNQANYKNQLALKAEQDNLRTNQFLGIGQLGLGAAKFVGSKLFGGGGATSLGASSTPPALLSMHPQIGIQ